MDRRSGQKYKARNNIIDIIIIKLIIAESKKVIVNCR